MKTRYSALSQPFITLKCDKIYRYLYHTKTSIIIVIIILILMIIIEIEIDTLYWTNQQIQAG